MQYKDNWKGWGDWLGTATPREKEYVSFEKAREFARSLGFNNREEWLRYCKSGKKPKDIPNYPIDTPIYKNKWKGWGDWLGTDHVPREWAYFTEAREFARSLGLKSRAE